MVVALDLSSVYRDHSQLSCQVAVVAVVSSVLFDQVPAVVECPVVSSVLSDQVPAVDFVPWCLMVWSRAVVVVEVDHQGLVVLVAQVMVTEELVICFCLIVVT